MKKIYLKLAISAIISVSTYIQADELPFAGRFGHVGIGYDMTAPSARGVAQISGSNVSGDYNIGKSYNFGETLAVGYNYIIDPQVRLGVGFEYNVMIASPRQDVTFSNANGKTIVGQYLKKNSYDFFLAPGYVINDTGLAYVKLGYSSARGDLIGDTINFKGYNLGLGYKHLFSDAIYVFGEFNYSNYGDQTSSPVAASAINGSPATLNVTYNNTSSMFLVGYGFKF